MAKPAPSRVAAALDYLERLKSQAAEFGGGVVENLADRARSVGGLAYEALATDPNMGRMTTAEFSEAASRPTPRLDQAAQDLGTIGRAIVTQPLKTGQAIVQGEIDRAQEATTSPRAAGKYAGSFIDPMRIAAALRKGGTMRRDIFVGESSKTWNAKAAQLAEEMEAANIDPKIIWEKTGTFRSPDGKLRQEISDENAYLRQEQDIGAVINEKKAKIAEINQRVKQLRENTKTQPDLFPREFNRSVRELSETKKPLLEDIQGNYGLDFGKTGYLGSRARLAMHHPEAFEAYPELGQRLIVRRDQPLGANTRGQYSSVDNRIDIGSTLRDKPHDASSTALHELQHAIQQQEGFARGGSPLQFTTKLDEDFIALKDDLSNALVGNSSSSIHEILGNIDLIDRSKLNAIAKKHGIDSPDAIVTTLKVMQNKATPQEQYRRLAGEAEARAVQKRVDYDPYLRRKTFPLESYDVPINELIIKR